MAWTTPKTDFQSGDVLTAAEMNAIGENLDAIGDAWTSYTPTWTNVTLGTSPTHASAYMNAGKLYVVRISLTLGTGGALTGAPEASLPNGSSLNSGYSDFVRIGWGSFVDASPLTANICHVSKGVGVFNRVRFYFTNAAGTYLSAGNADGTTPWTWAVGDQIIAQFMYEAA